jgi:hypothetical protein
MKKNTKPSKTLCKTYRCTARTIRRWRQHGAPLNSPAKMRGWLANRKNIPQRIATEVTQPTAAGAVAPLETGAPFTLGRLEGSEADAFTAFQRALKSNDLLGVRQARETWLRVSAELRRYDRSVDRYRRQTHEQISREEVEVFCRALSYWINAAFFQISTAIAEPPESARLFKVMVQSYLASIALAEQTPSAVRIEPWAVKALTSTCPFVGAPALVEELRAAFNLLVKECSKGTDQAKAGDESKGTPT